MCFLYFLFLFFNFYFLKILFIYSWETHTHTQREREAETQAEGEVGSIPGLQDHAPDEWRQELNHWATQESPLSFFFKDCIYLFEREKDMQSKLDVLMMRVNEVEEWVSDIADKLMA